MSLLTGAEQFGEKPILSSAFENQGATNRCPSRGHRMTYVTSPRATLLALGLLIKGCFARNILRAPIRAFWNQILLPTAGVWFVSFLDTGAPAQGRWPML